MKTNFFFILVIFILISCSSSNSWKTEIGIRKNPINPPILEVSNNFSQNKPLSIAIIPAIRNEIQIEPRYDKIMENSEKIFMDVLEAEFLRFKRNKLVSRNRIKEVIKEISFQENNKLAQKNYVKKLGRLFKADAILITRIDKCIVRQIPQGVYDVTSPISEVSFSLQLIEVRTGEILFSCNHKGDSTRLLSSCQVYFEVDSVHSTIIENKHMDKKSLEDYQKLIHILVKEIVDKIKKRIT